MKLVTSLKILARTLGERLTRALMRPEDVIAYGVEQLEGSSNQIKLHLAELIVAQRRTEKTLMLLKVQEPRNEEVIVKLEAQVRAQLERIHSLNVQLADLEGKLLVLRAQQADAAIRSGLLDVDGRLRKLAVGLGAGTVEGALGAIEQSLEHREAVQNVFKQLDSQPLLGMPGQITIRQSPAV